MAKKYYIYVETTEWDEPNQPNHVYIFLEVPKLRTAKAIGYVRAGTKSVEYWKKPYTLDLRGRTFEALK
jgi:hypothetical protein